MKKFIVIFFGLSLIFSLLLISLSVLEFQEVLKYMKINNELIKEFINHNQFISIIIAFCLLVLITIFLLPTFPYCIILGLYFNLYTSFLIILFGHLIGSITVFLYIKYLFKLFMIKKFKVIYEKFKYEFDRESIRYLLFLRLMAGVPFSLQNILPAIFNVSLKKFFICTLMGLAPWAFIFAYTGKGVEKILELNEYKLNLLIKKEFIIIVMLFAFIIIFPLIYKKLRKII